MLANPIRGQVGFLAGDTGWTLSYSVDALIRLEAALGVTAFEVVRMLAAEDLGVGQLRTVFLAGLRDHHPETTEDVAGEVMGQIGIKAAASLIGQTFLAAFPPAEATKGKANPPMAGGTGPRSSRHGAKQA